jgi:peptidoglycan/xylan/chitin deacetylase (PgdA/CDA1 family)
MNNTEPAREVQTQDGGNFFSAFLDHTKCPPSSTERITCSPGNGSEGFFRLGHLQLFGRANGGSPSAGPSENLCSIDSLIRDGNGSVALPFDPTEIINNLRFEKYAGAASTQNSQITDNKSLSRRLYYAIRPLLPVKVRKHLQRIALQDWSKITFPAWPVDTTVEDFVDWLWSRVFQVTGAKQIPFIWYWPKSFNSCAIMTHDVETGVGQDFCPSMLKIEQEYGIKSAFELVPEVRYEISQEVMEAIRRAGSEVCVHGLNHDGRLFSSEELFRSRAKAINQYAEKWGARGFRSPVMYRNLSWYDAFQFSYDMSVPNVAHLDPQRGGCCTIFPYFVGDILELPLTTTQDYPLFNIIRSNPMEMWSKQMESIIAKHGLVSFIIHPDYIIEPERQALYRELLQMLKRYSSENNVWLALPREVDTWWRERAAMSLECKDGNWSVRGEGSERASVAYVTLENGKVNYVLPGESRETSARGRV